MLMPVALVVCNEVSPQKGKWVSLVLSESGLQCSLSSGLFSKDLCFGSRSCGLTCLEVFPFFVG